MKHQLLPLLSATILICTASAEWEPHKVCYVWTGDTPPTAQPEDMLTGEFYDYNRNPKGELFTYSGVYKSSSKTIARDLKSATKARGTGAKNPTGSPDVHGQFTYTLRELINGKYNILKKYYRIPHKVATPLLYMPPTHLASLEKSLTGSKPATQPESDFITEDSETTKEKQKTTGSATAYETHASWIGIFRGRVIAPRSMTFRFFAAADDAIAVRFNNKVVLETGNVRPTLYKGNGFKDKACNWNYTLEYQQGLIDGKHPDKKDYVVRKLRSTPYCNRKFLGITGGKPIEVEEGSVYPIEIIIGNDGGKALCYLLTQEVTPGGNAPLQLFRTNESTPSDLKGSGSTYEEKGPDFAEDSPVWKIAASKKNKKSSKQASPRRGFEKL